MSQDLEKTRLDRMPNALNQSIVLSSPERAQLVSCLERGAEARLSDIDHGANPYLFAPVIPQGPATREDLLNVCEWMLGGTAGKKCSAAPYRSSCRCSLKIRPSNGAMNTLDVAS